MNAIDIINKIKKDNKLTIISQKRIKEMGINKFQGKLKTKLF